MGRVGLGGIRGCGTVGFYPWKWQGVRGEPGSDQETQALSQDHLGPAPYPLSPGFHTCMAGLLHPLLTDWQLPVTCTGPLHQQGGSFGSQL